MDKEYQQQAVKMLAAYNGNKVRLRLMEAELINLSKMVNANMAVRYDESGADKRQSKRSVVENEIVSIEEKRGAIQYEIARLKNEIEKVDIVLANLPEVLRIIIKTKYIDQKTWAAVEVQVRYSPGYIRKDLKNKALAAATAYLFPLVVAE